MPASVVVDRAGGCRVPRRAGFGERGLGGVSRELWGRPVAQLCTTSTGLQEMVPATVPAGGSGGIGNLNADGLAVGRDGRSVYVANHSEDNIVVQLDAATDGRLTAKTPAKVATQLDNPIAIAVSPDGANIPPTRFSAAGCDRAAVAPWKAARPTGSARARQTPATRPSGCRRRVSQSAVPHRPPACSPAVQDTVDGLIRKVETFGIEDATLDVFEAELLCSATRNLHHRGGEIADGHPSGRSNEPGCREPYDSPPSRQLKDRLPRR